MILHCLRSYGEGALPNEKSGVKAAEKSKGKWVQAISKRIKNVEDRRVSHNKSVTHSHLTPNGNIFIKNWKIGTVLGDTASRGGGKIVYVQTLYAPIHLLSQGGGDDYKTRENITGQDFISWYAP